MMVEVARLTGELEVYRAAEVRKREYQAGVMRAWRARRKG